MRPVIPAGLLTRGIDGEGVVTLSHGGGRHAPPTQSNLGLHPTQKGHTMPTRKPPMTPKRRPVVPTLNPKNATNDDILIRFGHRLQTLRLHRNLTQLELSKHLGIGRAHLSDVERGLKAPHLPMIEVFALGFKISLSELFKGL